MMRLPHASAAPVRRGHGSIKARPGTHQPNLIVAPMLLFSVASPTSVTAVLRCRGPYSFCSAAMRLWSTGSVVVRASPADNDVPVDRTSNFTEGWSSHVCAAPVFVDCGSVIIGSPAGAPAGAPMLFVTPLLFCTVSE